jgi:hypothetical protein
MLPELPHPVEAVGVAVITIVLPAHGSLGGGVGVGSGELLLQESWLKKITKQKQAMRTTYLLFI